MFLDLYTEDGKVRRYVATDMQGKRVRFVGAWLPTSVPHDLSKRCIRRWWRNVPGNGGSVGGGHRTPRSGLVRPIRHEDGKLDVYDYSLVSNLWTRTVTHLHEQSPSPVSGKTTRDVTLTNARGEIPEEITEAFIDGIWYTIARNRMTYNEQCKRTSLENLAGQVTTTAWDCCFAYGYNACSELTNAVAAVDSDYCYAYNFDDIGNRETSFERGTNSVYAANQLNQSTPKTPAPRSPRLRVRHSLRSSTTTATRPSSRPPPASGT